MTDQQDTGASAPVTVRQVTLTDEQNNALDQMKAFARDPPNLTFCLHGLAGTGKTTVLSEFARVNDFATLCTLTGKAASILRRKTGLRWLYTGLTRASERMTVIT